MAKRKPAKTKTSARARAGRPRLTRVAVGADDAEIPIANEGEYQLDEDKALFLMWAGAYGDTKCFVWADHFEDAFEEFVEWLDDNAPGVLTDITVEDLKRAAEDEGIAWQDEWPDDSDEFYKVVEAAEVDMTAIGHTTLKHGQYIPSWEWGGDEITDDETLELVRERSEDPDADAGE